MPLTLPKYFLSIARMETIKSTLEYNIIELSKSRIKVDLNKKKFFVKFRNLEIRSKGLESFGLLN